MSTTYREAGVNLDASDQSTKKIANLAKSTFNVNVLKDIGLFAGFYQLSGHAYQNPILTSSIDGVGTKLKIAFMLEKHDTIGQDLVNHCVNDIMTSGADPLFFLDYIGSQKLEPDTMVEIVDGMARACKENGCALIGGETAEMPGFYAPNEYDLVGAIVGIVDKDKIIDGSNIQENDILIGLPSNGFHTNGYSLIRKVLLEIEKKDITQIEPDLGTSWGEVLLKVHKSYKSIIQNLRELPGLVGISHITGGGIEGNTSRLLNEETTLYIDYSAWDMPGEFKLLQQYGNISDNEMKRVFNCGIGLILVINANHLNEIEQKMRQLGEEYYIIGRIEHK